MTARTLRFLLLPVLLVAARPLSAEAVPGPSPAGPHPGPREGEEAPPPDPVPEPAEGEIRISAGPGSRLEGEEMFLAGYVDVRYGETRLQADSVWLNRSTKDCRAQGNVILDSPGIRLTAQSAEVNLETGLGTFHEAYVQAEPSLIFTAERLERIGTDRFLIHRGTFTTCNQPTPYWSFHVARGLIHLEHYAYLHHLSFRVNGVPGAYLPYLVWPVKQDRATGLLIPEVGYSRSRGAVVHGAFFWAMRRNMDSTFFLDVFGDERLGTGLEYRFLPNATGAGRFHGYYLNERETDADRWFLGFREDQRFSPRWRLLADVNLVSDGDYYLDFERDLGVGTNPSALSRVFAGWDGAAQSVNLRVERREQFSTAGTLDQSVLPEVEWRSRERRLGRSPLFFAFESSLDSFHKETSTYTGDYRRVDLFPRFSAPWHPAAWLQVDPSLGLRGTYYTQSLPGGTLSQADFHRGFLEARLDLLGPRFARSFSGRGPGGARYRHTVEPGVSYRFVDNSEDVAEAIPFDEIDRLGGDQNLVNYSLTTRLYRRGGAGPGEEAPPNREITSLSLAQSYSFADPLSLSTLPAGESQFSPIQLTYRLNPTETAVVSLGTQYDVLFHEITGWTLSSSLRREKVGTLDFSWVRQDPPGTGTGAEQIRIVGAAGLLGGRLLLDLQGSYDLEAGEVQDQRYRIGYNTQCCGFAVEWFQRQFVGVDEEEVRFTVNLKGVGTVVDFHTGTGWDQPLLY